MSKISLIPLMRRLKLQVLLTCYKWKLSAKKIRNWKKKKKRSDLKPFVIFQFCYTLLNIFAASNSKWECFFFLSAGKVNSTLSIPPVKCSRDLQTSLLRLLRLIIWPFITRSPLSSTCQVFLGFREKHEWCYILVALGLSP